MRLRVLRRVQRMLRLVHACAMSPHARTHDRSTRARTFMRALTPVCVMSSTHINARACLCHEPSASSRGDVGAPHTEVSSATNCASLYCSATHRKLGSRQRKTTPRQLYYLFRRS